MSQSSRLSLLPSGLISHIFGFLAPRDICTMESVGNHEFRVIANWDDTWRKRLIPVELHAILLNAHPYFNGFPPKLIYRRLVTLPFLRLHFNDLIISGDCQSGKYSCFIGACLIDLREGHDVWTRVPNVFPRFPEALILSSTGTFELDCRVETLLLSVDTQYEAYLIFRISEDGFGFQSTPLTAGYTYTDRKGGLDEMVAEAGEEDEDSGEDTDEEEVKGGEDFHVAMGEEIAVGVNLPYSRADHLMEVKLVSFFLDSKSTSDVKIRLSATDAPTMHGLMIEAIEIRPVT